MSRFSKILETVGIPLAVMVVTLAVFSWIVLQIRARYRESDDPAESTHEMLTQYRELHEQGELSEEEFRLIKSRLANTLNSSGRPTRDSH
jgi:uncharacterized membrane protein